MNIRRSLPLILIVILLTSGPTVLLSTRGLATYRDYDTFMKALKNLADQHPSLMTYQTVGKTVENRNITMFLIGNPDGGRVFFDGAIHGEESLAGEVLYSYAKWLVTSNAPVANRILAETYTLIIPALDADEYNIVRTNAHHVDLNRNFATNWQYGGSTDPNDWYYRGPSPLSEPESQTVTSIFQLYRPSFYVNVHRGGSVLYESSRGNRTYYSLLSQKMTELSNSLNVTPYPHTSLFGSGFAMSDATLMGITSYLFEVMDWTTEPTLSQIDSSLLPRFITVAAVLSQERALLETFPPWDLNRDGFVDLLDIIIMANAFNSSAENLNWNPKADLNGDMKVDLLDALILGSHYGEQYS